MIVSKLEFDEILPNSGRKMGLVWPYTSISGV